MLIVIYLIYFLYRVLASIQKDFSALIGLEKEMLIGLRRFGIVIPDKDLVMEKVFPSSSYVSLISN